MMNKGVTLISLVITILVLIILTGISINLSIGDNSILTKAKEGEALKAQSEEDERQMTSDYINSLNSSDSFDNTGLGNNEYFIVNPETKANFEGKANYGTMQEFKTLVETGQFTYKKASLYEDINLNCSASSPWTGIGAVVGSNQYFFSGEFDGKNHHIYGLYMTGTDTEEIKGLFLVNNGIIKNVKITGEINTNSIYVGSIAGVNFGTIENCYSCANVKGKEFVGGITGVNRNLIQNCAVLVSDTNPIVEGSQVVGGISGDNEGSITLCINYAEVKVNSQDSSTKVSGLSGGGGITGTCISGSITNCGNLSKVTVQSSCGGGIAGTSDNSIITCCYNRDDIWVNKGGAGGIVGFLKGNKSSISFCYNENKIASSTNIGGIVGDINAGKVSNCYNLGQIIADVEWTVDSIGGICGGNSIHNSTNNSVINCYSLSTLGINVVGTPSDITVDSKSKVETDSNMRAFSFLDILNSGTSNYYKDYYLILSWQRSYVIPNWGN